MVNKTRVKMNLTGSLRGNSKTAAKEKSDPRMPKTATTTPGKTTFLKEFLHDNPQGNVKAANELGRLPDTAGPSAKPSSTRREHRWV